MFNKLKQFKDLRSQAKTLEGVLAAEQVQAEREGVVLVMDGNQKVISITLPEQLDKAQLESVIPQVFEDAVGKVKQVISRKMQAGEISMPNF